MNAAIAADIQGQRAGFVSRVVADVIDGAVIITIGGILLLGAAVISYFFRGGAFDIPSLPRWVQLLAMGTILAAYLTYGWSGEERTLGKYLMGLRVTTLTGEVITVRHAFARVVAYIIFPMGLVWALVSRRGASLQDLGLRTVVVYDLSYRRPES
jgi:uncharacterized RDD family membrane protein YckC